MAVIADDEGNELEAFRKAVARRIVADADRLVDELFAIAYDPDADPKVRLSAISMLMDRGIPKLGVQHTKEEESEERGSRTQLRDEIERMIREQEEDE